MTGWRKEVIVLVLHLAALVTSLRCNAVGRVVSVGRQRCGHMSLWGVGEDFWTGRRLLLATRGGGGMLYSCYVEQVQKHMGEGRGVHGGK